MVQQQEGSMPQQQQGMAVAGQTLLLHAMALPIVIPKLLMEESTVMAAAQQRYNKDASGWKRRRRGRQEDEDDDIQGKTKSHGKVNIYL
uniref:Uncharacterized protein n=1 Tax=Oryza meridionalis TaxID=40149 RepID=A0A0E0C5U4_9ORYZ